MPRPKWVLAEEDTIEVPEAEADVDTGLEVEPGQRIVARDLGGEIWSGMWGSGHNGPAGWNTRAGNANFPLTNARAFGLIGRFGDDGDYFYIGKARKVVHRGDEPGVLQLRVNDDVPGNGSGEFTIHVRVEEREEE